MNVKELADLNFKSDMMACADPVTGEALASGGARDTIEWFNRYAVDLFAQVSPFVPGRPPEATGPDGFVQWWHLDNGVILGKFGKDPFGGGYIIPPDAQGPPPIKEFEWLNAGL